MTAIPRNLSIRPSNGNLHEVYWTGGGDVPAVLKGEFTSKREAKQAITSFQSAKMIKVKTPAIRKRPESKKEG